MPIGKRAAAEFFGTFWLVFGGCGAAVLAAGFPSVGIGFAGVALAFGLTVLTMAFAIGHISGCHLNPAVSVGLVVGKCFPASELPHYIIAQVLDAIAASHPIEGGILYDQNDALKLGCNIVTYCLAEYQYGRFFDHQKVYHQAADADPRSARPRPDRPQRRLGRHAARRAQSAQNHRPVTPRCTCNSSACPSTPTRPTSSASPSST